MRPIQPPSSETASFFSDRRWKHLFGLFEKLLAQKSLPQLDRWLGPQLKKEPRFGKRDRYWYREMIFAAMRYGYLAAFGAWVFQRVSHKYPMSAEVLAGLIEEFAAVAGDYDRLRSYWQGLSPETFFSWVRWRYQIAQEPLTQDQPKLFDSAVSKSDPRFEALQSLFEKATDWPAVLLWHGLPLWLLPQIKKRAEQTGWNTDKLFRFLKYQQTRPPIWLRLNQPDRADSIVAELRQKGFQVMLEPPALCVRGHRSLLSLAAFKNGEIEIQDWASQQIGACVQPGPLAFIWDCCAGGGGKTLQLAARSLDNQIYASDIRDYKLLTLRERVQKAGLKPIHTCFWDGASPLSLPGPVARQGGFDWILLDGPCSGSGTWRRNPEARFRYSLVDLPAMVDLQKQLLCNASRTLRPGGRLVYATCSLFVEENEAVIADFLKVEPGVKLISQTLFGCPEKDSDTMFAAVLQKQADGK